MKTADDLEITFICVAFLWVILFLSMVSPFDLRNYGIRPRDIHGLPGLVFSPFLHSGVRHLFSNSTALAPLLFFSLAYGRKSALEAVIFIALVGGAGVWLFGSSNTVHIGSSGIIFGLLGYLLALGLFKRRLSALLVSLAVAFYYGWMLFALFVVLPGVSWTGHFFGFIAGVLAAWFARTDNENSKR
jgi:membrane associated rhomboid family serine protease